MTCSKSNTPETSISGSDVNLAYGTKVSFGTGGNSKALRVSGWSGSESQITWTEGTAAVLTTRVSPTNEPVAFKIKLLVSQKTLKSHISRWRFM
jgi:hypothetical protein